MRTKNENIYIDLNIQEFYDKVKDVKNDIWYNSKENIISCMFFDIKHKQRTYCRYSTEYIPEYKLEILNGTYQLKRDLIIDKLQQILRYKKINKILKHGI